MQCEQLAVETSGEHWHCIVFEELQLSNQITLCIALRLNRTTNSHIELYCNALHFSTTTNSHIELYCIAFHFSKTTNCHVALHCI